MSIPSQLWRCTGGNCSVLRITGVETTWGGGSGNPSTRHALGFRTEPTTQQVVSAPVPRISTASNFTIEFTFMVVSTFGAGVRQTLFYKDFGGGSFFTTYETDGELRVDINSGAVSAGTFSYGEYHLFSLTFDAITAQITVYIDGVLTAQYNDTGIPATPGDTTSLGSAPFITGFSGTFDSLIGDITDFHLYGSTLSAAAVADHFAGTYSPTVESELLVNWTFSEPTGPFEAADYPIQTALPVVQAGFTVVNDFGIYLGAPPTPIVLPPLED